MTTPPPAQFRSQADLIDYLSAMERRLAMLEQENEHQQQAIDGLYHQKPDSLPAAAADLPDTNLLSRSFLSRAFAVWGHYFVAQLIIGLGIGVIYLVLFLLIMAAARGGG